jgi:hypothetical protein
MLRFDAEEQYVEAAIRNLIQKFPQNNLVQDVMLKASVIRACCY